MLDAFEEDAGRAPHLVELLEILREGARTLPNNALADGHPDEIVGFVVRPRTRARNTDVLGGLNDGPYVAASDAFNHWWQTGAGAPITLVDLAAVVLEALRYVGPALLDSSEVARLTAITPKRRRAKARARIGDIIAVPTDNHHYHLVVLVCRNRFGAAFGLIRGRYPLRNPPAGLTAAATGIVRYCDEEAISTRRWRIVGHDSQQLGWFPADPEIYHRPGPLLEGLPTVGEFGSGETATGHLRDLTAAEALAIDLAGSYEQVYLHEHFEPALAEFIAPHNG
ncbi:hypothetical protein GA0070622_2652 [Micromonospora sediminicola]|uniref:Uncharacterized protein n=1 Tax=Micromonospora sediminicola TaxID=946078 RepID=A0A1A9B9A0_9ACTN|nr:hypothetical protein GA0070622_2652 [Micromonospora sediminicola]